MPHGNVIVMKLHPINPLHISNQAKYIKLVAKNKSNEPAHLILY